MTLVRTVAELRRALADAPRGTALVPTMGALHEGHLSLVRAARAEHATVVVSVFVNPTQFNEAADLDAYPRDEARDVELAVGAGATIVFAPSVEEMYPDGFATTVRVRGRITESLEGAARGVSHFDGMATIVTKLLVAAAPDTAYFGAKDAQQVVVVRRLVADLRLPVRIAVCPTSRDDDGLARSSRNTRLSADARARALAIPRALAAAERQARTERSVEVLRSTVWRELADLDVEYAEIVDPDSLAPLTELGDAGLLVVAARVDGVRLIDNTVLVPDGPRAR